MGSTTTAVVRAEAARLATLGDRQAALDLLASLGDSERVAAVSVLRARILCQRGEFTRALESWREALAIDPDSDEAKRGVAFTEKLARSPIGRLQIHGRRVGLALVVIVGVAAIGWATSRGRDIPSNRELAESLVRIERQSAEDVRGALGRANGMIQELKQAMDANQRQLQSLAADQARASAQEREQLRRLDRRTAELIEATKRLESARAASPARDGR